MNENDCGQYNLFEKKWTTKNKINLIFVCEHQKKTTFQMAKVEKKKQPINSNHIIIIYDISYWGAASSAMKRRPFNDEKTNH